MKQRLYKAKWSWGKCKNIDKFVKRMCLGKTLNFPCGRSQIGDMRADLDKEVNPDVIVDLMKPETWNWEPLSFDTVLCDPPYSYYNKFRWLYPILGLAKKRLILSTPLTCIDFPMKLFKKQYFISESNNGHFLRLWQVFDRLPQLEVFSDNLIVPAKDNGSNKK